MMKILVTGGCGFVGTNLSIYLKNQNYKVESLDNLSRNGSRYNLKLLKNKKIKNYKIDIKNFKELKKLPKYDLIIDCCAEASIEISKKEVDRVFNTNLVGTFNLLKKIKNDKSKIIFLSSSRVYPIRHFNIFKHKKNLKKKLSIKKIIDEKTDINGPKSLYGLTKLSSEMLIQEYSYAFGIKYLINRCGVISGPLQFGKQDQGFVSLWVWRHLNKKNLKYIGYGGHGNQVRDILHIDDLCRLIVCQIKNFRKINNQIFTVGGSKNCTISLKDLTIICEKITQNKIKFQKITKTSIYDIPYYISNNKKVTKTYGWKPRKNVKNIVLDIYKWLKINKKNIKKYFK